VHGAEEERFRSFAADVLPWLTRTATLLVGDRHRGDDLVQETLVKAYVKWRHVRVADDPRAYLRRILVRCAIDASRSPHRRETAAGAAGDVLLDRADPAAHRHRVVDREPLVGALALLPPRQRAVLVLRFLEDLDVATTAEVLGVTTGTVKSTTHDGLRSIRSILTASGAPVDGEGGMA
jgi:RNA polymerase sigma-70 factor (sigma-E family)